MNANDWTRAGGGTGISQPPPALPAAPPPIAEALERYRTAYDEWKTANNRTRELDNGRAAAEQADVAALAQALNEGKRDPGPSHVTKWEKDQADARRRGEALLILAQQRQRDLRGAVRTHGDTWRGAIRSRVDTYHTEALDHLGELEAIASDRQRLLVAWRWSNNPGIPFAPGAGIPRTSPTGQALAELRNGGHFDPLPDPEPEPHAQEVTADARPAAAVAS